MSVLESEQVVEVLSEDQMRSAVSNALKAIGLTSFEQLEEQARTGDFKDEASRRTWYRIRTLGQFA